LNKKKKKLLNFFILMFQAPEPTHGMKGGANITPQQVNNNNTRRRVNNNNTREGEVNTWCGVATTQGEE
jgi:hypothetical protein